jgi:hypothetical protein
VFPMLIIDAYVYNPFKRAKVNTRQEKVVKMVYLERQRESWPTLTGKLDAK